MKRALFIGVLALGFAACPAIAAEQKTLVISDFSKQADRARWTLRGNVQEIQGTPGGYVYRAHKPGQDEWPALVLRLRDGIPNNWGDYDTAELRVDNRSGKTVNLAFHLNTPEAENVSWPVKLKPGVANYRIPLYKLERVRVSRLGELHLFITRPPFDTTLIFERISVVEDLGPRLNRATLQLSALQKASVAEGFPDVLMPWESECESLSSELAGARSEQEQEALRARVVAFEQQVVQNAPRALSEARMRRAWKALDSESPYALGWATSMEKVFPYDLPFHATVSRTGDISAAGNENEAVQLLILADGAGLKDVRVEVGELKGRDGKVLPPSAVKVAPMGYAKTKTPPNRVDYVGWYPEPILDFLKSFDVRAGVLQSAWISVRPPSGTPAGVYTGEVSVRPSNAPARTLTLRVKVWGFDLTKETHLRTALSYREDTVRQVYGELTEEMNRKYQRFLLEYRLNPDNIYNLPLERQGSTPSAAQPLPTDRNVYLEAAPPIEKLKRWNEWGMNAFNIFYIRKPQDLKPNAPYPDEDKRQILEALEKLVPIYKQMGIFEKAYVYGFDEVSQDTRNAMFDIFSAIKQKFPDLQLLTTAYDPTYGEAFNLPMVDGWCPLTARYNPERAAKARAQGKEIWWYICVVPKPPHANIFMESQAVEARVLMGLQTAKFKPDGFLYYADNRWPLAKQPITFGPFTDWPTWTFWEYNGDGSFLCPGPDGPLATIRLENMRDGIEDNEYLWLLGQEIERLKKLKSPASAHALKKAEKALAISDDLTKSTAEYTRDPVLVYAKREEVAKAIVEARKVR